MKREIGKSRLKRRIWVYSVASVLGLALAFSLLWALRELLLPSIVGALGAYLCRPILNRLKRMGMSNLWSIVLLFAGFFLVILLATMQLKSVIPDQKGKLELRVRIQYKLTEQYNDLMGLKNGAKGNLVFEMFGGEVQPFMDKLNNMIMLSPDERRDFVRLYVYAYGNQMVDQKYFEYFLRNVDHDKRRLGKQYVGEQETNPEKIPPKELLLRQPNQGNPDNMLARVGNVISLWLASPFVFLFLLIDEGEIKKNLVTLVPNRYFEMVLTVIDNVDQSIGKYLRGTLIECSLVGLTFVVCLFLIGIEFRWAMVIGIVAGIANAIPFLGPAIGLVVGLGYTLVVEQFSPLLPFVDAHNMIFWVLATVAIAQGLDNAVFQPVVLGSAVSLHPLVVVIGVMGGSILLGFAGMLFAIPAIVVSKVIVTTLFKEMKAYRII
ncbi:MAG: AI-2E family transporter [bacterium]|nr:AI-2E family transporter [bacterium]